MKSRKATNKLRIVSIFLSTRFSNCFCKIFARKQQLVTITLVYWILSCNAIYAQQFNIKFTDSICKKQFTGRVFVFLSKENSTLIDISNWTKREPVFALDVVNLNPNKKIVINAKNEIAFPVSLNDMERGEYYATAVFDNNQGERAIGLSAGNFISKTQKIKLTKKYKESFYFVADSIIPEIKFKTSKYRKEFKIKSTLLSAFHKRDIYLSGGIALPDSTVYTPNRSLPLMISITGFGGDYKSVGDYEHPMDTAWTGIPFIYVELDGNCPTGHCVYANSENNGPYGDALVYEFLPALEKEYHCNGFRYVTGHSSGGWASLWLKLNYPDKFNFCWSSSPDYVDFTSFQDVDIYKSKNFYYHSSGTKTNYATIAGYWPILSNQQVSLYENVLHRGEQLCSFEAVYSPKAKNGFPQQLWNRQTGAIDSSVAEQWKKYDVHLLLQEKYQSIKHVLDSQLVISVGYQDNFAANKPVEKLKEFIEHKKMGIPVLLVAGDHFTIDLDELQNKVFPMLRKTYTAFLAKEK